MTALPDFNDVLAAARRIAPMVHHTPVLTSRLLNAQTGAELFFKAETFQRVGAFKFRGAANAIARLDDAQKRRGVVAFSSGNHAQAIALAAARADVPAVIVMPADSPAIKRAATQAYGAEIVLYDRFTENREVIGQALSTERGLALIPPFEHPDIIAGQGTAALELFHACGPLDMLVAPVGGGGLISGCALAASGRAPACAVVGIEPAAGDDARRSLAAGHIVEIDTPETIADGAQTRAIGPMTFALMRAHGVRIETQDDASLARTMKLLAERMKIVVEPTGCLAAAAVLEGALDVRGKRVGIILSGGNVDMARFAALVSAA
ncbi:threo-3-hydroxy-L-aspartate ammonia-lyase [Ameyamaea chiangmaiensis]|nr:threo-3-hydroxy-L-aspartate ammonia-lyase [Ameyamaea chiangmaiensis]MBS4075065.1 threo-3-hydroxy-L-aspartate ammonia-lyase [Ameyamaea chiangmaiensis]